jgi:hypothetical protein
MMGDRSEPSHSIRSATSSPPSPALALREFERAAAESPADSRLWQAALIALMRGRVSDFDIGSGMAMGAARPLRVAVVTPYFREDAATLHRCHASVLAQTYPCRHIMVADGQARPEVSGWEVDHVCLPRPNADYGDTPRVIGGERAVALGCDAIAYLDADNAYRPHHVESLVYRHGATSAPVVYSGRTMHFPDGQLLPVTDPEDGRTHIDTSCLFLVGPALAMCSAWLAYPRPLAIIDDRLFVRMLRARGLDFAFTGALTLRYTVHYAALYRTQKLPVPPDARPALDLTPALAYCRGLSTAQWRELEAAVGFPLEGFVRSLAERSAQWPE